MSRSYDGQISRSVRQTCCCRLASFLSLQKGQRMIRFDCDWCSRTKASDEIWILGLAAESVGVTAARREITILPSWKRETAVHPLAVHFCSEECKDDYMAQLFNERPALAADVVVESTTTRKAPTKSRKTGSSRPKRRSKRRSAA